MISAGRVLIKPCGEWKADTTYYMLDLVNHNGYAYLAKRTVVGIEPSIDPNCWHNMLDINKVIEEGIAGSLAEDVGKLLEERFADLLSEARYVTDLFSDFDVPTFVRWDSSTENTPYKAGISACYEGYALVFGNYSTNHTVSAWAKGGIHNDCFMHTVSDSEVYGWDNSISASGGTMTGDLKLGGGIGKIGADVNGAYLGATSEGKSRTLNVTNSSDNLDAVKLTSDNKEYRLFGEHNADLMTAFGYPKIVRGTYSGNDTYGAEKPTRITFDENFVPEVVFLTYECTNLVHYTPPVILIRGVGEISLPYDHETSLSVARNNFFWNDNVVEWYLRIPSAAGTYAPQAQWNSSKITYHYVALGKIQGGQK